MSASRRSAALQVLDTASCKTTEICPLAAPRSFLPPNSGAVMMRSILGNRIYHELKMDFAVDLNLSRKKVT